VKLAIIFILFLLTFTQSFSQTAKSVGEPGLRPSAKVIHQVFCGDGQAEFLVDVSFTNLQTAPLILRRRPPFEDSISISRTSPTGEKVMISSGRATILFAQYRGNLFSPDPAEFVTLYSGEKLEFRNFPIGTALYGPDKRDDIVVGDYTATLNFSMFPYSNDPKEFHWEKFGKLWTTDVSVPVEFSISKNQLEELHSLDNCHSLEEPKPITCYVSGIGSVCTK
jgi:hypothetical protein